MPSSLFSPLSRTQEGNDPAEEVTPGKPLAGIEPAFRTSSGIVRQGRPEPLHKVASHYLGRIASLGHDSPSSVIEAWSQRALPRRSSLYPPSHSFILSAQKARASIFSKIFSPSPSGKTSRVSTSSPQSIRDTRSHFSPHLMHETASILTPLPAPHSALTGLRTHGAPHFGQSLSITSPGSTLISSPFLKVFFCVFRQRRVYPPRSAARACKAKSFHLEATYHPHHCQSASAHLAAPRALVPFYILRLFSHTPTTIEKIHWISTIGP